ncbi:MAG: thiol oxidoreductase, partial [Chitinophagia bacterium]|nr:thiol oxidoreductase [Chitinophagia bacterium]
MKRKALALIAVALLVVFAMCRKPDAAALNDDSRFDPRLSGGAATVLDFSTGSFSAAIPGLNARNTQVFSQGDKLFEQPFVAAPAPRYGGLGPVYNNSSCANCHHNDGFGVPSFGEVGSSLLLRLSVPGTDEHGGPLPVPGFGGQLQNVGLFGVQPEATVNLSYTEAPYNFTDGEVASLRTPSYTLENPYMPLPVNVQLSPRLGPPVFGLGLLENIPEATILSFADPNDADGDGVKGHANYVYNPYTGKVELGRFGVKANTSSLLMQVATAFQQDMGITSYVHPQKSVYGQPQMAWVPNTPGNDIADTMLDAVVFYVRGLSVPGRRNVTDPTVKRGEVLFSQVGCATCHRPTMYTGVNFNLPALSNQRIHPYTDMLVHDMGPGLADNRP